MYNTKKEFDRHVQEIFRNMKDGPEKNLKCLNVARRYYSFDEYEIAKRYVSRYLNEKETAPARKLLGQCYEFLNQLDKALVEYKTSLELLPEQKDLVLKVCELVLRTESKSDLGRTRYWCDRLEKHFPHHQMVFKLKEFLIKADGSTDWNKLETLILAEIKSRPTDVTLRERILRLYLETGRDKEAYQHGIEIEKRHLFRNSLSWYQCLADVFKSYKSNEIDSLVWEVWILERYAYLTLDEHLGDENTPRRTSLNNANAAVYLFDQKLHQLSLANFPTVQHENHFYQSYLNYLRAQLTLHLATLVFKTSKSHKGSWREVTLSAIPLLEFAYSAPTPSKEAWFPHVSSIKRQMAQIWNLEAAYRKSQAGHVLIAILQHRPNQSLAKVAQHCYGNWRESLYKQLFTMRDQAYGNQTSHFVQEATLGEPPQENPTSNDLRSFDDISQKVYPNSLHHLVWLGLQKDTAVSNIDSINPTDFRCQVFEELQLCCSDLNQSTLESLDRLDCEAFLYATVLCAKSGQEDSSIWVSGKSGIRVPACITSQLCSVEQSKWWSSAYDVYKSKIQGDFGQVRPIVQRGIEVIRVLSNHGLDVRVIVHLARIFTNRAQHLLSIGETRSSEAYNNRAAFFWRKARVLLQQILNNVSIRKPHHVYFTYQGKELTNSEAHLLYDEARFFLACENMKQSDYDEALSQFDQLTSPMASYYQAQIYIKLAEKQISNVPREVITSEMRSLHIIYLTKARDALYLTSDRLRSPLVSQRQPINLTERLAKDIEDIETRLRRIKPDCFTNDMTRQDDGLTDEESVSTAPSQGGGGGDIIGNGHFGASYYTTSSTLLSPKHHEPQNRNFHSTPRYKSNTMELSHSRSEARPSPERLDAQLRQLIATNDSMNLGVQVILRQVLEEIRGLREDFSIQVTKQGDDLNRQLSNFSRQLNELSTQCADQWDLWDQRENSNRQLNDQFLRNLNELKRDLTRGRPRPTITNDGLNSNQTNSNADLPLLTSDAEDDMFVFAEEEYPDEINITAAAAAQIAPYPNFQGYAAAAVAASAYRQMTGVIGTNTVTYGAPPPLQATQNPPPAPPPQFFRGVDPTGLMYAPMGYYPAQGALPFSEGQQLPDFRAPFTQPPPALPTTAVVHPKVPVNVVITSSDTLPTSMPPTQPPLSVTIPPQHRLGTLPPHILTTQNSVSTSQPHQFQISMPSQPTLPQSSLLEHLTRPMVPLSTNNLLSNVPSPIYSAVTPDKSPFKDENKDKLKELNKSKEDIENDDEHDPHFEPIIQMPEVDLKTGEEDEEVLHESRVKLFRFTDKEWKERGVGQMKILKNINTGKIRVLMRRDQVLTICANHFISPEMELKSNTDRSFIWAANDFADEEVRVEKLFARFKTSDEAKLFKDAWDTARSTAPSPSPVKNSSISTAVSTDTFKVSTKLTPSKLEIKQNEQTTKLGGFTFNSPPSLKTKTEIDNKPKDKVEKPSPFASFSFGTSLSGTKNTPFSDFSVKNNLLEDSSKTPKSKSDNKTLESKIENQSSESKKENIWFTSPNTNLTFGSLAGSGSGFKTDTNFKGFVGAGTPLFLKADKTPETKEVQIKSDTPKSKENKQEDDEFVPTTEFTPVIPLPELVEVRTGEEGQEILWQERVKLLRFDNDGKQWKERGTGKMKILHDPVSGIVRLLMRREQVYKLCCNHLLTTSIKFQPLTNTDRAWTWFAHDYSEGVLNMETLAIRFKNSDQANEFKRIVEDLQSRMENDKLISEDAKNSDKNDSNKKPIEEDSHETCTLADLYKPKQGSWECKECLIRNEESAFKCIACETPNLDKAQEILNQPSNSGLATKFTFGIPKNSNDTPLVDLFKPKQGSWECKACLVRNEESASKCIACEIPNPDKAQEILNQPSNSGLATKFTFGIPKNSNDTPLVDLFKPKQGSWECKACLVRNEESASKCIACEIPNPDKAQEILNQPSNSGLATKFTFGIPKKSNDTPLVDLFKPKQGSWECKACLIRNEESASKCIACETSNPDKTQDISNEPSNGGLSTKFTYGIPQDLTDKPNSGLTTKFIFGIPPSENKSESATTSQSILSDSTVGSTTKYTFGVPSSDKNDSETTSTTSSTNSSLSTTFPFNSQPNSNMFSFGIYEDKSTTSNQTGKLPSLKEIFQSKLGSWDCKKCLSRNETSTNYCTSCESINHNKSPSSASHSTLQEEKKSSFSINTTSNIQNGSTSSFKFSRDTNTQGSFNFGNSSPRLSTFPGSLPEASGEDNKNVAFGNTGMHPFKFSGIRTKSPGKSPIKSPGTHGISGNEDSGSEAADEDEGDQIYFQPIITLPNVPTQTGEEEEETLYQHRAKLFRFFAGEWKERGIGEVKLLKHKETGKIRILMRRDQVLKICANHYITLEMRLDPKDDKSWIWAAQDFSEGEILQEKFAIRFKTSDIANDFKEAFLQAQSSLSDQVQEKIDDILSTSNTKSDTSRTLQSVQRVLFSANDDQEGDDIEIIYVNEVTPEEKEEARRLLLPDNFYLYKKLPPCSGCRGCRDDDEQAKPTPTTTASTSTSAMTSFTFSLSTMSGANSSSKEIDTSKTLFGMSKSPAISSSTFTFGQNYNSPSGSIFGGTPPSTTGGGSAISSPSVFGGATPKSSTSLFKTDSISSPSGSLFPSLNSNKEDVNSSPVFPMKLPETTSSIFGLNKSQGVKFGDISTINDKKENNKPFGLFAESFKNSDFDQNRSLDKEISFGKKVETTPTNQKENKPSIFVTSSSASNIINSPGPSLMGSVPPAKEEALNLTKINMDTKSFLPTETSLSFANLASGSTSEKPLFLQNTSSEFKWSGTGTPLFSKKFENFETSPTSPEAAGEHDPHFEPIVPLPDMVDVKTGEEDENKLFNSRAKLYRYEKSTKEWKERGVGDLKILHNPKLGTYRLLLRREQVHKLVLNQLINTDLDMNFKDNSDKTFCWVGHNYVDDETNLESLSVRFKNAEIALLFYDTVRDCLERLRLDPASGHIEARNNEDDDDDDDESGHDGYDGNYEEEDGDDDEDDDDEVERDGESDYEDEDVLETYVEKMATVTISGVQKPILGAISIILHSHFGISAILKQNDQEEWKFLTPFTESDQVKHIKTECKWTAKDHMQKPPIERKIIAKFSSESAAGEFAEAANNLNC